MIPIWHYQVVAALLFMTGVAGVLVRRNVIVVLMSIELMLNAGNLSLVAWSRMWGNVEGQVFALIVVVVAAAEVAVGLAILLSLMRNHDSMSLDDASRMRW